MLGPEEDDNFSTEYGRFALNSRGIPEDYDNWVAELNGRAKKNNKIKKKTRKNGNDE